MLHVPANMIVFWVAKYCTAFQQHHEIYCSVITVWYQNFQYVVNTNIMMNKMSDDFTWLNVNSCITGEQEF